MYHLRLSLRQKCWQDILKAAVSTRLCITLGVVACRYFATKKFIDWKKLRVVGGCGGNGCLSFRREANIRYGGPNGGNGGNGGSVIFVATARMKTLRTLGYHYKGVNGGHGKGDTCDGKNGLDTIVKVPVGTVFKVDGEVIADLSLDGESFTAVRGGKGGKGNTAFATPTKTVPKDYTEGVPGEEQVFELELKTIADIGLVGLPNAGKSTLLRSLSKAKPKVAEYAFTTLNPSVGIIEDNNQLIAVADIPGLLPGAHCNYGLGHAFLRHVERCNILVYVLNGGEGRGETIGEGKESGDKDKIYIESEKEDNIRDTIELKEEEGRKEKGNKPYDELEDHITYSKKISANTVLPLSEQLQILKEELALYNPALPNKAKLIVINKVDLKGVEDKVREFCKVKPNLPVIPISGLYQWNIKELKEKLRYLYNL